MGVNLPRARKSCKALADSSRLKIVGLLAQQPYTVEQLAAMLDLRQREKE
ncbi:MAG: ArsR family transcriptional regulator [Chloroflexi bacterium]|nr:ArsR family transcriptional regulator [Chloroflexota bacterium]